MTALHSTDSASVYVSLAARVDRVTPGSVSATLFDERSLVRQLAMRRTLFVFPRDLLPAVWGSASARVAGQEQRRLVKEIAATGEADAERMVEEAKAAVLRGLAEAGTGLDAKTLREREPALDRRFMAAAGTKWETEVAIGSRVLTVLGAEGRIVRGVYQGHWRTSRPIWELTEQWLGETPPAADEATGYAELVRRWLGTFGPGTEDDIVWWLGSTKGAVRRALADLNAAQVSLDSGDVGWVLPDDLDDDPPVEPWAALLPVLDPTTMGWKQRDFYLAPEHRPKLFDTAGNGGATAWWNGRIVGCWMQDDDTSVRVVLVEDAGSEAVRALDREAARLTEFLDGTRIYSIYASPHMRAALEK